MKNPVEFVKENKKVIKRVLGGLGVIALAGIGVAIVKSFTGDEDMMIEGSVNEPIDVSYEEVPTEE